MDGKKERGNKGSKFIKVAVCISGLPCISEVMSGRWLQLHSRSEMTRGNKKIIYKYISQFMHS